MEGNAAPKGPWGPEMDVGQVSASLPLRWCLNCVLFWIGFEALEGPARPMLPDAVGERSDERINPSHESRDVLPSKENPDQGRLPQTLLCQRAFPPRARELLPFTAFTSNILIIVQTTTCRFRHFSFTTYPDLYEELIKNFFSVVACLTVLPICRVTCRAH